MLVLLLVALWFILRGDLLYVFPCVILFLCFSVLLVLRLPRLGNRELILVLFVRLLGLCLFGFVGSLFLLGSGKDCGLWLSHSLDFSLTFFGDCGTPWTFLLPFFCWICYCIHTCYTTLHTHSSIKTTCRCQKRTQSQNIAKPKDRTRVSYITYNANTKTLLLKKGKRKDQGVPQS